MSGLPGQQIAGRYRTVALQAIGVAVIAGFIFVAFLRPSEPGDLTGIDAPGADDNPRVERPQDPKDRQKPKTRNGNRPGSGTDDRRRLSVDALAALVEGVASGAVGGSTDAFAGTSTDPGGDDGGGQDPPDNQYGDLPGALMAEVGTPAIFREIDP